MKIAVGILVHMGFRSLIKKFIPTGLFPAIEPYGHLAEAVLFNAMNGFPSRGLKVIGVTGTNGKTTTAFMIHRMLHEAGYKIGLMSTVAYGVGDDITPQMHHMTNVRVPEMMKRLKCDARPRRRMAGDGKPRATRWPSTAYGACRSRVAVMTNVTHEHLAYHRTFERYGPPKAKMFKWPTVIAKACAPAL